MTTQNIQRFKSGESAFNFGYGNSPYFWADFDPVTDPSTIAGMAGVVYGNFMTENKMEWRNTVTRDLFFLNDILDRVYDDTGMLVGGTLSWAKY